MHTKFVSGGIKISMKNAKFSQLPGGFAPPGPPTRALHLDPTRASAAPGPQPHFRFFYFFQFPCLIYTKQGRKHVTMLTNAFLWLYCNERIPTNVLSATQGHTAHWTDRGWGRCGSSSIHSSQCSSSLRVSTSGTHGWSSQRWRLPGLHGAVSVLFQHLHHQWWVDCQSWTWVQLNGFTSCLVISEAELKSPLSCLFPPFLPSVILCFRDVSLPLLSGIPLFFLFWPLLFSKYIFRSFLGIPAVILMTSSAIDECNCTKWNSGLVLDETHRSEIEVPHKTVTFASGIFWSGSYS